MSEEFIRKQVEKEILKKLYNHITANVSKMKYNNTYETIAIEVLTLYQLEHLL